MYMLSKMMFLCFKKYNKIVYTAKTKSKIIENYKIIKVKIKHINYKNFYCLKPSYWKDAQMGF